ncbi:MAG: helix-turn-helix transcriptional regulator [Alphaproteobacteria bacterium]|nr:helix-turn-helix transcriptional regulator [Alphaproteobacteria bacterium]
MDNRLQKIGKNIRRIRKERLLCQIDLAVTVGIDRAYLSEIENGKTNTSINILLAIADALDVSIVKLLDVE